MTAVSSLLDSLHGQATGAVVTFGSVDQAARHRAALDVSMPFLVDGDRSLYQRFGLGRGKLHRLYNPGTIALYWRLIRSGQRIHQPEQDTRQLGGDFVIGPDQRLRAEFRPSSPDQRPSISALHHALTLAGIDSESDT